MRFLKNKIRLAEEALQRKKLCTIKLPDHQVKSTKQEEEPVTSVSPTTPSGGRAKRSCSSYSETILASTFTKPTKNMIINYGKAIFSFAMSDLAKGYIDRYFKQEAIDLPKLHGFLLEMKPKISGYKNFEGFFVAEENDSEEVAIYKGVLKMLGEVFIKYFSVNWIIHGKVAHKMVYLKNRHMILRRIIYAQSSV